MVTQATAGGVVSVDAGPSVPSLFFSSVSTRSGARELEKCLLEASVHGGLDGIPGPQCTCCLLTMGVSTLLWL